MQIENKVVVSETIELIQQEYLRSQDDWYLGYSGGKDSTALLILALTAIRYISNPNCVLHVIYSDTGVEFPVVKQLVIEQFRLLRAEIDDNKAKFEIIEPAVEDRFFSMIIGKGYVPPTFLYRWCTKRLRIKPIQKGVIEKKAIVLLGVRKDESTTRNYVIEKHRVSDYFTTQSGYANTRIFCPLINYSEQAVWEVIANATYPNGVLRDRLRDLYRCIGTKFTESNKFLENHGNGRFGCWTCTVVKKDKAMDGLINNGNIEYIHLREFMGWLKEIRSDGTRRGCNYYTGEKGKGPFCLATRKEILDRLLEVEKHTGGLATLNCTEKIR